MPVGAITEIWALRYPHSSPAFTVPPQRSWAAATRAASRGSVGEIFSAAWRCLLITRSIAERFRSNPGNGPIRRETSADMW